MLRPYTVTAPVGGIIRYRLKLGDYRIGLALENDIVVFVRFLDRKDIHKYFP